MESCRPWIVKPEHVIAIQNQGPDACFQHSRQTLAISLKVHLLERCNDWLESRQHDAASEEKEVKGFLTNPENPCVPRT